MPNALKYGTEPGPSDRYPVLRLVARIYSWAAVVVGVAAFGGVVFGIARLGTEMVLGIFIIASSLVGGVLAVITLFAASELLRLLSDIESNTRQEAEVFRTLSWSLRKDRELAGIRKKLGELLKESAGPGEGKQLNFTGRENEDDKSGSGP